VLQFFNLPRTNITSTASTGCIALRSVKIFYKSPTKGVTVNLMNSLIIDPNAPLNSKDSSLQTFGCRCRTYINCGSNSMENVCAFVKADNICLKPPNRWASQYEKLLKAT